MINKILKEQLHGMKPLVKQESVSLKGMEGEWTNIGTEFLEFNGEQLKYSW